MTAAGRAPSVARAGLAVLLFVLAGCQPKNNGTLLVVEVASDLAAGQMDRIEIETRPARGAAHTNSFPVAGAALPVRLALVPEGDPDLSVDVVARAFSGVRATVNLAATVRFRPGEAVVAHLFLSRACVDQPATACPGAQQCTATGCVARAQVAAIRAYGQPAPPPPDSGVKDAGVDRAGRETSTVSNTWEPEMAPSFAGSLSGIHPVSETESWAVGFAGQLGFAFKWDGAAFVPVPLPPATPALTGVWAAGSEDVWVVGYNGTILHRVGGGVFAAVRSGVTTTLEDVFGTGPNDVWFVGAEQTVLHWDGTAIARISDGVRTEVVAGAASGTDVWLVGVGGGIYRRMGGGWTRQGEGLTTATLYGAWAGGGRAWAVGNGVSLELDGGTWQVVPFPAAGTGLALWGSADNDLWAAGRSANRGAMWHFNGAEWTEVTIPAAMPLQAVRGRNADDVWAVGGRTVIRYR